MANTPVDPGVGSLTLTGAAPVVAQPRVSNPGVGALTLVGGAPTIARTHHALPGVGSLTLLGDPPAIARDTNGDPEPGLITLVGDPPVLTFSDNTLILLPSPNAILFTGPAPSITQTSGARLVVAGTGSISLYGPGPIITQSANGIIPGTPASYSDLITNEHRDKPRFKAVVELLVTGLTDGMKLLASIPVLYQFNNAQGQQLDRVGQWIGLSRFVNVPGTGTVELSDSDYRLLLISKIAANHYDGSFEQYQQILDSLFVGYGFRLVAIDSQAMSIDIYVIGATPTPLQLALMQGGFLPPKPEGVRVNNVVVIGSNPVFGLDYENEFISGPDFGFFY